jgi:hypothetical protein
MILALCLKTDPPDEFNVGLEFKSSDKWGLLGMLIPEPVVVPIKLLLNGLLDGITK